MWLGAPQCKTHSEDLRPQGPRILTLELLQMQQSTNRWYVSGDASQFRKPPLSKDRDTGGRWQHQQHKPPRLPKALRQNYSEPPVSLRSPQYFPPQELELQLVLGRRCMHSELPVLSTACRCRQGPEKLACSVLSLCNLCKKAGVEELMRAEELMLLNCGVGELLRVLWTAKRSNQSIL